MGAEIYYFSGTGNSLYAARKLAEGIPDAKLIPIISLLKKKYHQTVERTVGFVFPVHALTIPMAVKHFLKRTDFRSADYIFAVATREGTIFRGFKKMNHILRRQHKKLHSHFILNMFGNDIRTKGHRIPDREDLERMEVYLSEKLDTILKVINSGKLCLEKDTEYTVGFDVNPIADFLLEKSVLSGMALSEHIGGVNYYYHDDKCIGCGICEKVCLSGKIRMEGGRPVWQKGTLCYMCFACLNYCPEQSVQIKDIPVKKSFTKENARYPHPYASLKDIMAQKGKE